LIFQQRNFIEINYKHPIDDQDLNDMQNHERYVKMNDEKYDTGNGWDESGLENASPDSDSSDVEVDVNIYDGGGGTTQNQNALLAGMSDVYHR